MERFYYSTFGICSYQFLTCVTANRKCTTAHNFSMMNNTKWEMGTKIAKLSAVVVAVYLGMKFIFPIVLPFFIALILARLLHPLAVKIENKTKLSKTLSCSAAYLVFLLCVGLIAAGAVYLCYRMGSVCLSNAAKITAQADEIFCRCCERLEQITGISTDKIQWKVNQEMSGLTDGAVELSKEAGWCVAGWFAKMFVTFVAALLILNDYGKIMGKIKKTTPGKRVVEMLKNIKSASGAYLRAQGIIMGLVSIICIVGLLLLGTQHALIIGIAIGFCDALPFLGTGTIFIPWALIDLILGKYKAAAGYMVIYLICTFTRQILEPRLVGKRLGVPPLAVLMSIYIGIQVYGGVGVIFGPVSALIIYEIVRTSS